MRRSYWGAVVAATVAIALPIDLLDDPGTRAQAATPTSVVTVETATGHVVAPGFLGLSLEYSTIEPYAGTDPAAIDPAFVQLVRNLDPGQQPVLRIGGDSTDWAWSPTPSVRRPLGIRIDLSPTWLAVTRSLADTLNAKLILGINLEAGRSPPPRHGRSCRDSAAAASSRSSSATSPSSTTALARTRTPRAARCAGAGPAGRLRIT